MCYYSKQVPSSYTRSAAKEGEDVVLAADNQGHHYPQGSDGKIVCVLGGTKIHLDKLEINPEYLSRVEYEFPGITQYIGKPLSSTFIERSPRGYSADRIRVGNYFEVHLVFLKAGSKMRIGDPKPVDLVTKLGMDDPSIMLDHQNNEPTPGVSRAVGRALGLCSIVR